jgi:hypothetical protein
VVCQSASVLEYHRIDILVSIFAAIKALVCVDLLLTYPLTFSAGREIVERFLKLGNDAEVDICMYVCMHVCMRKDSEFMCVCMYVCMYNIVERFLKLEKDARISACMCVRMCACMYVCMYLWGRIRNLCVYVCMYVCMYNIVQKFLKLEKDAEIGIRTYVFTYIRMHNQSLMCAHVFVCIISPQCVHMYSYA